MADSQPDTEGEEEQQQLTTIDLHKLCKYLKRITAAFFEDENFDFSQNQLDAALSDPVNVDCLKKFIGDAQVRALFVKGIINKDEVSDDETERSSLTFEISIDVTYAGTKVMGVVFCKLVPVIEQDKSITAQLSVHFMSPSSPYQYFHSFISSTMAPYFKTFIKDGARTSRENEQMVQPVEKKISELEMGLLHLQQNIGIPEINLVIHPTVAQYIKQAENEGRKAKVADFGNFVEDAQFLNQLQSGVNRWIREIQKVTKLDRDPASGTALQEISFWLNLERALLRIQERRDSVEISLTLDILKHGKRFHATLSFDTDTGLKQALEKVNEYNPLMKDFPLHDLLAASDLERINSAVQAIFSHMKKIRNTRYPVNRALRLIEAISTDLMNQMIKVLASPKLMLIPFEDFERIVSQCFVIFNTWEEEYDKVNIILREIMKKKRDESMRMHWKFNPVHKQLQGRLEQMRKFRRQHDQLIQVIARVLKPATTTKTVEGATTQTSEAAPLDSTEAQAIEEVNLAYENVKEVDCLDISKDGVNAWEQAMKRYDERIDRVETRITARLRDQLGLAKNANEMFRIFSRFNALFIRPHIRGAIREYQTQLIQRVKDDIETLHEKFKIQFSHSMACDMSDGRDIPPVSGQVIWLRQIEAELEALMQRVEAVLGKDWASHIEGQKLKQDGDSFKLKLNTNELFEEWCRKVSQKQLSISGNIFIIESHRSRTAGKPNQLKLRVNFHPEIITLSKEVRNLKGLGFRLPLNIVNKAHQANQLYPNAISLIDSVRMYEQTCKKVDERERVALLVAGLRKDCQDVIQEGCSGVVWESYKVDPYVKKISDQFYAFQDRVEELLLTDEEIAVEVRALETCQYSAGVFKEIIEKIQKSVDNLSLKQYSNLGKWVERLDNEIESKLAVRLEAAIKSWTAALQGLDEGHEITMDTEDKQTASHKIGGDPKIMRTVHELRMQNGEIILHPPVEEAREKMLKELFAWQAIVLNLPRIKHTRYQVGLANTEDPRSETYRGLLAQLPGGQIILEDSYDAMHKIMNEVIEYTDQWKKYKSLWTANIAGLYSKLSTRLRKWMTTLQGIRDSRKLLDTSEVRRCFGPVVIEFGKVQSKVMLKFDNWHKEVLNSFGKLLNEQMSGFHTEIARARTDLESQSLETSSTADAVQLITYVQNLKRKHAIWDQLVGLYGNGQQVLERHRFTFPGDWLYAENVAGEWSAFSDIMKRKEGSIKTQIAALQNKIIAEDKVVENKTQNLLSEWDTQRPVQGNLTPYEASKVLTVFEGQFNRMKEERDNLRKAKEALELSIPDQMSSSDERMQVSIEELQDLKGVWSELSKIWEQIDEMKEKTWLSVAPRKLRTQIDALLSQLRDMPAKLRHYPSFDYVKKLLQSYAKVNSIVTELKSDAVKERHWKSLMKSLRVRWSLSELTLGQVWDVDLEKNERAIRDVLLVAQGERALEEFLRMVSETWRTYNLDLINYQNKCKLIRGWDELFEKVKEHINSVTAMKLSPYYKEFEEEANNWSDKLNRIHDCFDIWIDVQRRWVYLEGIFTGSADIKNLLPVETSRFQVVGTEFLGLMKKVAKTPAVLEVVNIPNVQKQLDRLADLLNKIQKALGEYLERERASFPRFYFVGDEDLLEIIGNSKNISRLQKHFKKMFAGVAMILLNEDSTIVTGLASKEGEEVIFQKPVSIADHPKINDWLTLVEKEMRNTLARLLAASVEECAAFLKDTIDREAFFKWLDSYQSQLIVLSSQINWSEKVDAALSKISGGNDFSPLEGVLKSVENMLNVLADSVLHEQPPVRRKKLEHLIIESVHQRDVCRTLLKNKVNSNKSFEWLAQMRFYFDPKNPEVLEQLCIQMANAKFNYGFEYLGVQDKIVQTPLTDRCYLTMTQALHARLGGSPFGPAGTGKTESVKALGNQLGRFVLVFNCDETFDFQAMGRIFVGLCQVGAWGCFDEFNRLEERMLSACSQQIQTIQEALTSSAAATTSGQKASQIVIELVGKQVKVNPDMAIFITMNPGYAGRSNLPDNLKKLFRSLAMTQPDRQLIAQVMLYSQGFRTAEKLAGKIVPFFKLCLEQLSSQSHYDFGLRALKSVLVSAGNVKRDRIQAIKDAAEARGEKILEQDISERLSEQEILIQSVMETVVPKLVADDIPLLNSLLSDVFPGVEYSPAAMESLRREIENVCKEEYLVFGEQGQTWMEKVLQLFQITQLHHGLMMVGPSGSGKSTAWRVLLKALQRLEGVEGVANVIDPKSISKDHLYGNMDPNTREWTDGLFTSILRKIIDNVRGELGKRQWIIFDGDVDPEWVENLNSVLDDNKLLTLPNGERLAIPPNVRIMFEVQDLRYATLATVSRCGMVWFSEDVLSTQMIFDNFLLTLRNVPIEATEDDVKNLAASSGTDEAEEQVSPTLSTQRDVAAVLEQYLQPDGLVERCLIFSSKLEHVMDFTRLRALSSLFSMLKEGARSVLSYNGSHPDFPMDQDTVEQFTSKWLVFSLIWSFAGDGKTKVRNELGSFIRSSTTITLPPPNSDIIDYEVTLDGKWNAWSSRVPQIDIETHRVAATDLVVPTVDTVRHEHLLYSWLAEHKPIVLCGPPGSGKTMTLFSALRSLPDMEVVGLNFSSATTPELMMKTFDHYCEYRRTPNGVVLSPVQLNKWLIVFCDEINLPSQDKYGTQRVISFLRQILEYGGFYRTSDQSFVKLERIQFVGACNPPTDPGRVPMSHRFLRHVPVIYVDYPQAQSLQQIYGTFNRAMMRLIPELRAYAEPLTNAMVEFYMMSQENFTQDMQPHYIYSPREMTRWVRGIHEALKPLESLSVEGLVRIWAHEALRLFQDRLVTDEERLWTDENIDKVAMKHFPNVDFQKALARPILYSNWLSKDYIPVDREELRDYVKARLKVFYEEELDVPLVLFNEVLEHVLRIDRIFRQPQGHLLLIGVSGAGKTTLSRFVAWMNGLSVFQIKMHNKYTGADFDDDLRAVLRRSGCRGEKVAFIMDESNIKDAAFLERMNTLLANGEVPGLFEGDEYTTLMSQCKEGAQRMGQMLDSSEELYKWFTSQVITNLHVVFTMNPSTEGLKDRAATSPALFNRCVLNWFGDWSTGALYQVAREFTNKIDLENSNYIAPDDFPSAYEDLPMPPSHRHAIINAMVYVHKTLFSANERILKKGGRTPAITPRHYLDFINQYVKLYHEKRSELEEQQLHLNVGLSKIRDTFKQVEELQKSLSVKRAQLKEKDELANQKLKQMVADQQEAEKRKVMSQELHKDLQEQQKKISQKQEEVMDDLAKVEPAVQEAQQAVKSIKKQQLTEVRSLANPPPVIKLAVEAIAVMLGETDLGWKALRQMMMRETFISTIVNFNTDDMSDEIAKKMRTQYLTNPDFTYEKVNRASVACGPMVKWAIAQLGYADMLRKVEPLRNEMKSLEKSAEVAKIKSEEVDKVIADLEKSIAKYKEEYAILIAEVQAIKSDLSAVEKKVNRSVALLESLGQEKERWDEGSEGFKQQMSTILSDCLVSSAFLTYAGYYDQHMRDSLFQSWLSHLHLAQLKVREEIARIEYLCNPDERLRWTSNGLPTDDLCVENAIMLRRFNRFPLIIDPSGQATVFIENEFKDRKITKTSFLDDSFRKNLESALRFGNPLLVQDVENYDPILNPVLNHELRRTGGRVLITLGDQDIDFSPSFTIFLTTRDPTVEFPPDICSRVCFVNFTVTRASLQSQCLNKVLKAERPDVDQKKSDLLKLQGEFQLRLRQLEKSLLQALNDVKGRILDDDSIITHLETLKTEAREIASKVEETDSVMAEVESVSQQYVPLAQSCSSIYFTLESLNQVHFLYQYSLKFFLGIFESSLTTDRLTGVKGHNERLQVISTVLFQTAFNRTARGMLHRDQLGLAVHLSRIELKQSAPVAQQYEAEFQQFLHSQGTLLDSNITPLYGLTSDQFSALQQLSSLPAFKDAVSRVNSSHVQAWLQTDIPEVDVPVLWEPGTKLTPTGEALYKLLIIQALRPDRLVSMAHMYVSTSMGNQFLQEVDRELDLSQIIDTEITCATPVLMCSVPGYDASGRVMDLAAQLGRQLTDIAIGSAEGFSQADKAINSAIKSGRWVMLKNVHLAPSWLVQLEKKLHSLQPSAGFRLFLTMEINPKLPANLLRSGRVFVFEPPPGIRANLLRTFSQIPAQRMAKAPNERARLYFLVAWFHAIVQERLTYAPLGWSKKYEFNESDLKCACDTLDTWIDDTAKGRSNLPPQKIPWDALRALLSMSIYGGKIDNDFDQRLLDSFIDKLFCAETFDMDYTLVPAGNGVNKNIIIPDAIRREQFVQWADNLADAQTPAWLGLPNNAEKLLLTNQATYVISQLLKMQLLDDEEELAYQGGKKLARLASVPDSRPAWMRQLLKSANDWLKLIPQSLAVLKRSAENIKDPLFRYFEREISAAAKLLADVRRDLQDVILVCQGEKKPTNYLRKMNSDLTKGIIPDSWKRYTLPPNLTVIQWIIDFSERIKQFQSISKASQTGGTLALKNMSVWLGGMFIPEAYITATRQYVAQANSWSLEELYLQVTVADDPQKVKLDDKSFGLTGLSLHGATCSKNVLTASSSIQTELSLCIISWIRFGNGEAESKVNLPVYLNPTRAQLLFTLDFSAAGAGQGHNFYERGVALTCSKLC